MVSGSADTRIRRPGKEFIARNSVTFANLRILIHDTMMQLIHYPQLDSTNNECRRLLQANQIGEGAVIMTAWQSAGRGFGRNRWESAPNQNLTISILLQPQNLRAEDQFFLTCITSLALKDTVGLLIPNADDIRIKWPNDLYAGNKKLAGILVENDVMGPFISNSILGIGLNVNQKQFESDAPNPISVALLSGQNHEVSEVLQILWDCLMHWYQQLQQGQAKHIRQAYLTAMYRFGQWARYACGEQVFEARITGTDPHGQLLMEDRSGKLLCFEFKEVRFCQD